MGSSSPLIDDETNRFDLAVVCVAGPEHFGDQFTELRLLVSMHQRRPIGLGHSSEIEYATANSPSRCDPPSPRNNALRVLLGRVAQKEVGLLQLPTHPRLAREQRIHAVPEVLDKSVPDGLLAACDLGHGSHGGGSSRACCPAKVVNHRPRTATPQRRRSPCNPMRQGVPKTASDDATGSIRPAPSSERTTST